MLKENTNLWKTLCQANFNAFIYFHRIVPTLKNKQSENIKLRDTNFLGSQPVPASVKAKKQLLRHTYVAEISGNA